MLGKWVSGEMFGRNGFVGNDLPFTEVGNLDQKPAYQNPLVRRDNEADTWVDRGRPE